MLDFSNPSFLEPRHRRPVINSRRRLGAQLGFYPLPHRFLREHSYFSDIMTHGLLAVDVFTAVDGAVSNRKMGVIGCRDVD